MSIMANDESVINYLTNLWTGSNISIPKIETPIQTELSNSININLINNDGNINVEIITNQNDDNTNLELDTTDKTTFKKQVKDNLAKIREIGFRVYHNISLEKEVNLNIQTVNNNEIEQVYDYKKGTMFMRKSLMTNIAKCTIFPKYKSGDKTKPENFRYLVNHHNTIKILDRIWCMEVIKKCGNNLPDHNIFKSNLIQKFNGLIIDVAMNNTTTTKNIVLLDIQRAFDSLEWDILENLLLSNLTRKMGEINAKEYVEQYMTIIRNRELYYNNHLIPISKGIPTGLPSSNIIFTLALEEILIRWFSFTNYKNNKEFVINVYVDDIYLKILELNKTRNIVLGLIKFLEEYNLKINMKKSRACNSLDLNEIETKLKSSDYYLGIPFTRNIKLYGKLLLNEFNYNNNSNLRWIDIYYYLNSDNIEMKRKLSGFLNYKLKPICNFENYDIKSMRSFIKENYLTYKDSGVFEYFVVIFMLLFIINSLLFLA
jgi:hypothetical protein